MGWLSTSLLYVLFTIFHFEFCFPSSISSPQRHPDECSSLLRLKASLRVDLTPSCEYYSDATNDVFSFVRTSLWNESTSCCFWSGITCDGVTGHVTGLDLSCSSLQGRISANSSLFLLRHLQRLDLSENDFSGSSVVSEFGRFKNMTHLDLSSSNFSGDVPLEIPYLPKLVSFQLNDEFGDGKITINAATFIALAQNSTSLRELGLAGIDLSFLSPLYLMNLSSSLTSLQLKWCKLRGKLPEYIFHLPNLKALSLLGNEALTGSFPTSNWISPLLELDLSYTGFSIHLPRSHKNASFPSLFNNLTKMVSLSFSNNNFIGQIPSWILALPHLEELDLSQNAFTGEIGEFQSNSLVYLSLSKNKLNGFIPRSLFQNVNLGLIDLSSNSLTGNAKVEELSQLKKLVILDLSSNNLSLTFNNSINYSFDNLQFLNLSSCNIKEFPNFIRYLKLLFVLDLSCNKLQGRVPEWFSEVGEDTLTYLNLSQNSLTYIKPVLPWKGLRVLDLHSNLFSDTLPIPLSPSLSAFIASKNQFSGEIPTYLCNLNSLEVLDLSYNNLSGEIPPCMGSFSKKLSVLDLRMNKLRGSVRIQFPKENKLRSLNLNGNRLEGPLPKSLVHWRNLEVLDLGNNLLNGAFPGWLEVLPKLQVLILRSNKFHGSIANPNTRFPFHELRIMDVSTNEFTGALPTKFFDNFVAMMDAEKAKMNYMGEKNYQDSVMVTMKGLEIELVKIQTIFTTIDFSNNNFTGEIPELIGRLKSLKGLNFSHNKLAGIIPSSFGNLTNLEWLDLSSNELPGKIPIDLVDLTWLSFLNLSNNRLEGPIPRGKQFDTFGNDSFAGNSGLCGFPLSKTCNEGTNVKPSTSILEKDDSSVREGFDWKIVMMGYGSGVVIGISIGYILLFSDGKLSCLFDSILRKYQSPGAIRPKKRRRNDRNSRRR